MLIIGLTGSIGMGKSTAASLFRRRLIPVCDADKIVHDLLNSPALYARLKDLFPGSAKNGVIDRDSLGNMVFSDPEKLHQLEQILHPLVRLQTRRFLARAARNRHKLVVLDIPLLFEKNLQATVDLVMTVSAPAFVQKDRVMARPGMSEEKFAAILARQMPDRQKRRRSDIILRTGRSKAVTFRQLQTILNQLDSGILPRRTRHARNRSRY